MTKGSVSRGLIWVTAAVALLLSACGKDNPFLPEIREDNQVWIQSDGFNPRTLTVQAGTTVEWINKDSEVHLVDSGTPGKPTLLFTSKNIKPGESWSYTFNKAGTYPYYCGIHGRTGTIVVE